MTNANLTGANLSGSTLTNANFSGAIVKGVDFGFSGITSSQLYSTATYNSGDLTGIGLEQDDLTGWNFANQNLTSAGLEGSTLTNVNFTNANLTNANLYGYYVASILTNANFSGAIVKGANFSGTTSSGFTASQLYSTASYTNGDLTGIVLEANDLTGWNFATIHWQSSQADPVTSPVRYMQLRRTANENKKTIANPSEQQKSDEVRPDPYALALKEQPSAMPLRGDSRPFGFAVSRKMYQPGPDARKCGRTQKPAANSSRPPRSGPRIRGGRQIVASGEDGQNSK